MALEDVRYHQLVLEVGRPDPELSQHPALTLIMGCPEWVVGPWFLLQLYSQGNQLVRRVHVQKTYRSAHVAVVGVQVDTMHSIKYGIISYIDVAFLIQ